MRTVDPAAFKQSDRLLDRACRIVARLGADGARTFVRVATDTFIDTISDYRSRMLRGEATREPVGLTSDARL